eukprot:CAMPEP_0174290832 /NCGR_PEP_ID=MMETSP0809-20121228/30277_1 /TAXON_ID=73025 ORGANISM="Eutreptiella gymnastica-like, Strain CCMP1594" /NCGR_SAMPLE_ID=MMETSP0809 /ASSEMBLY_ACC=CAM_ASM_000658 /LENGTH=79 /DNA_ID=CAMNT_0015389795 /DNA_START=391 /DNA_END=627 /DNA_ORIENTATION=-
MTQSCKAFLSCSSFSFSYQPPSCPSVGQLLWNNVEEDTGSDSMSWVHLQLTPTQAFAEMAILDTKMAVERHCSVELGDG